MAGDAALFSQLTGREQREAAWLMTGKLMTGKL